VSLLRLSLELQLRGRVTLLFALKRRVQPLMLALYLLKLVLIPLIRCVQFLVPVLKLLVLRVALLHVLGPLALDLSNLILCLAFHFFNPALRVTLLGLELLIHFSTLRFLLIPVVVSDQSRGAT